MKKYLPFYVAIFASILLSFWLDYRETVINPDAICYLLSAQSISLQGIKGAMQLCNQARWPFYPMLIHALAETSHLSYVASAYLLNAFFSLITVTAFMLIVKQLGASRRILWLAAATILLAHVFNSVRESIIRDHGFWACYLMSVYLLLRYFSHPRMLTALAWAAMLIIATLFRIEGAVFLLFLPLLAFFQNRQSWRQGLLHYLSLNLFLIVIALFVGAWLIIYQHHSLNQLGRVSELLNQFQQGMNIIAERYFTMKTALAQHVLSSDSVHDAGLVLIIMMTTWYLVSVISNLSWIYMALLIYAWLRQSIKFSKQANWILLGYILINVLITFAFLMQHVFLSNRYLIALSLILMLWVPFALDDLLNRRRQLAYAAAFFIGIASLGGIFDFGYSKSYIHQGGDWIAANVPPTASLYANDYQLMYYSQHFGNRIFSLLPVYTNVNAIANGKWMQYDYLALRLDQKDKWKFILTEIKSTPVAAFQNKRGDRVIIYKISGDKV